MDRWRLRGWVTGLGWTALSAGLAHSQNFKLSPPPARVHTDYVESFEVGPGVAAYQRIGSNQLFGVPAVGSTPAVELALLGPGEVRGYTVTPDGTGVVFRFFTDRNRLYSQAIDGSAAPVAISSTGAGLGDVTHWKLLADGARVVFVSDRDATGVYELHVAPTDGSAPQLELSGPFLAGSDVFEFQVSSDGSRAVYLADQSTDGVLDLYSVPLDGSASAVRLNTSSPAADVIVDFRITPDSGHVVYRADSDTDEVLELFVAPLNGGAAPVKRSGALAINRDVSAFQLSGDGARIVYSADAALDEAFDLYSVPLLAGAPVKLTPSLVPGGDVVAFGTGAGTTHVVYQADQEVDGRLDVYSVPLDGTAPATRIDPGQGTFGDLVFAPGGTRVLFSAVGTPEGGIELFVSPVDASTQAIRLCDPLSTGQAVHGFGFSPDGAHVYFVADQDQPGRADLFLVPADGSQAPMRKSGPLVSGGDVTFARIDPTGEQLVYSADAEAADAVELFGVGVAAGAPVVQLNALLPVGQMAGGVLSFDLASDASAVFFVATQATPIAELWRYDAQSGPQILSGYSDDFEEVGDYRITPDVGRALFLRSLQLFSVPADGSGAPVRFDVDPPVFSFELAPAGDEVAFVSGPATLRDLWAAPADASQAPRLLAQTSPVYGLGPYRVTPDGSRVVWLELNADISNDRPTLLYSAPMDGSAEAVLLCAQLPFGRHVGGNSSGPYRPEHFFAISPDGAHVVYAADQLVDNREDLFIVPTDGSAAPQRLNPAPVGGGEVLVDGNLAPTFRFSVDGGSVYYLADQETDNVHELFRIPIGGGDAERVNGPLVANGDVGATDGSGYLHHTFDLTDDGRSVLYMADQTTNTMVELYVAPTDGSEAPRVLSVLPSGADVRDFRLAEQLLVYRARLSGGDIEIHGTAVDAHGAPVVLAADVASTTSLLSREARRVLYAASPAGTLEILSARLDGGGTMFVNGPLVPGGSVLGAGTGAPSFRVTADGVLAVYVADQDVPGIKELYATVFPSPVRTGPFRRAP